jgi:hypothetical protein
MVKVRYSEGAAIHTDPESCAGLGICFRPFIVRQHAPIVHPLLARPRPTPQPLPRERFRCVLGMLSSLEVKVLCPT